MTARCFFLRRAKVSSRLWVSRVAAHQQQLSLRRAVAPVHPIGQEPSRAAKRTARRPARTPIVRGTTCAQRRRRGPGARIVRGRLRTRRARSADRRPPVATPALSAAPQRNHARHSVSHERSERGPMLRRRRARARHARPRLRRGPGASGRARGRRAREGGFDLTTSRRVRAKSRGHRENEAPRDDRHVDGRGREPNRAVPSRCGFLVRSMERACS